MATKAPKKPAPHPQLAPKPTPLVATAEALQKIKDKLAGRKAHLISLEADLEKENAAIKELIEEHKKLQAALAAEAAYVKQE